MINLSLKLIKYNLIYIFKKNNSRCDDHMLPKKLIVARLYLRLQFLGGLLCFAP
jgi:hypothetical protein